MKYKTNWKTSFNIETNTYLLIITSNDNGLNAPIKRQRVANWIKKKKEPNFFKWTKYTKRHFPKEDIQRNA